MSNRKEAVMNCFTSQEIDLLQDGLDAMEVKNHHQHMMNDVVGSIILHGHSEEVEKRFREEMDRKRKEMESSQRNLRDRIVLLKAKLIRMKDEKSAEALIEETAKKGKAEPSEDSA